MADETAEAAKWTIGPPAPWAISFLTRILELSTFILTVVWVYHLGGVSFHATLVLLYFGTVSSQSQHSMPRMAMLIPSTRVQAPRLQTGNDTSRIFNWHPLLMSLAFPIFMAEAVLAYRKPLYQDLDRSRRKVLHAALHTAAILCIILAIIATFKSHNLKRPTPIPNLYSPHSYLGMFTFILSLLQYLVGLGGFLTSRVPGRQKAALSPVHVYLGRATFVLGLATMAVYVYVAMAHLVWGLRVDIFLVAQVGVQEKTTFVQTSLKPKLYSSALKIPATIQLLLALTGIFVLYHHVPPPNGRYASGNVLLDEELQDSEP